MQYQFLLDNLSHSDQIQDNLAGLGIPDSRVHFVTERSEDFAGHHIHEASIMEERDLLHSSVQGAILGLLMGALVNVGVNVSAPFGWQPDVINIVFIFMLFIAFGGWIGGLYGISHRNYRISKFEGELQKGKAIMLIYSDDDHFEQMKTLIESQYPEAKFVGTESNFDNPLRTERVAALTH
jgi:hypothetical protein